MTDTIQKIADELYKVAQGSAPSIKHQRDLNRIYLVAERLSALSAGASGGGEPDLRKYRGVAQMAIDYASLVATPVDEDLARELLAVIDHKHDLTHNPDTGVVKCYGCNYESRETTTPASPATGEDKRHVGDSQFESWYANYCRTDWPDGTKQIARDAYAAGMGDATPQPAAAQGWTTFPLTTHPSERVSMTYAQYVALALAAAPQPQQAPAQATVKESLTVHPAHGDGEEGPYEFGVGIKPNPKARYWQERAQFWRGHAIALGYAADDGTQRCPPANVDHATAIEGWHSAMNDAIELVGNAPDDRYKRRASRVQAWILTARPAPEAQEARDAARFIVLRDALLGTNTAAMEYFKSNGAPTSVEQFNAYCDAALALPAQGEG